MNHVPNGFISGMVVLLTLRGKAAAEAPRMRYTATLR